MKGKRRGPGWDDLALKLLSELWLQGHSAREIAQRLAAQGYGFTRNAVVSQLSRKGLLGVARRSQSATRSVTKSMPSGARVIGAEQNARSKRQMSVQLFGTTVSRQRKQTQNDLDYIRATVPYQGVHPVDAQHLTLSDVCDLEGKGRPNRCRWPTSHFNDEATYCAVPLTHDTKGCYCPLHSFRLAGNPTLTDVLRSAIESQLAPKEDVNNKEPT